jgi:DNA-binding NtrC family response regulator
MARVLVIDDDKLMALTVFGALQDAGHTPILARSDRIVFTDLERHSYDVVLTDLNMPAVSGWDVADWIGRHRPDIPVVAYSGALDAPRNEDEFDRFAAVMTKNGDIDKIGQVLSQVLLDRVLRPDR